MNGIEQVEGAREWKPRVIVKLAEAPQRSGKGEPRGLEGIRSDLAETARRVAAHATLRPYLHDELEISPGRRERFDRYVAIDASDPAEAEKLAAALNESDGVEIAYVEGGPTPPPVDPDDDPRSSNQGYLDAAPDGIDARWAWGHCDGFGIGFVDMEQGWTLNHEDLAAKSITVISGVNNAYASHGTAVLGEVVAVDNTIGDIGIAPHAKARVVSQYRTTTTYSTAAAILSAVDHMSAGDVLLLEAQTTVGSSTYLPVEVEQAVYDAIVTATDADIIVVEAAGNGGNDLDAYTDASGKHILKRGHKDFRDSGAIMVGAASSTAPHDRLSFSNYGSRIDCFGWGEDIDTTGGSSAATNAYTTSFGGTSGASPIVTGAALLLQSWWKDRKGYRLGAYGMREILSRSSNTHSRTPATDKIGVMPNLRGIIEREIENDRFKIHVHQYEQLLFILFGVLNDAPGVAWIPGKGPVPIDPGWGRRSRRELLQLGRALGAQLADAGVAVDLSEAQLASVGAAAIAQAIGAKQVAPVR